MKYIGLEITTKPWNIVLQYKNLNNLNLDKKIISFFYEIIWVGRWVDYFPHPISSNLSI